MMCTVCGCGDHSVEVHGAPDQLHGHTHVHPHNHARGDAYRSHDHPLPHERGHGEGCLHFGNGLAGVQMPGMSQDRILQIERDLLAQNNIYAAENRARLAAAGMFALNFVSSPGAGKTELLLRTVTDLKPRHPIVVIEGDQQTSNDAERMRATGVPAIQINTGKGCHLDAHMVGHVLDRLPLQFGGLLLIENVGNLVCPAAFDLGEAHKIVVLSVTEGEDKPLKYPDMFAAADLMLLNKVDLLPYIDFDLARTIEYARRVNPRIEVLVVSARTGEGLPAFYAWIARKAAPRHAAAATE